MPDKSPEQHHYETLYRLFRNLIWLGGILTIAAAFFIGSSISEIKSEAKEDISKLEERIAEIKTDISNTLANSNSQSEQYLNNLKNNTDYILSNSKYINEIQIKTIKEEIKFLTLQAAKNEIQETFENRNIKTLIDDVAGNKLDFEIEKLIDEQMEIISSTLEFVPTASLAVDRIRSGYPDYVYILDSLSQFHNSEYVRNSCKQILISKGKEYDDVNVFTMINYKNNLVNRYQIDTTRFSDEKYKSKKLKEIKLLLFNEPDRVDNIIDALNGIRIITKLDTLRALDFEQIRELNL